MPRRTERRTENRLLQLNSLELRQAIRRIDRRIEDLSQFDPQSISSRGDPLISSLQASIGATLSDVFGEDSEDYWRYSSAVSLDTAPIIVGRPQPTHVVRDGFQTGKEQALALLHAAKRQCVERLEDLGEAAESATPTSPSANSHDIFVVHGRDEAARAQVARVVEQLGYRPVILNEQPNKGRTLIEKFEEEADVGFAIVLMTPDDLGGLEGDTPTPRARQNVILELGYFIGRLGRDRVCTLKTGKIEIPSDVIGVGYTEMDAGGAWRFTLASEMKAAGYDVDLNKLA